MANRVEQLVIRGLFPVFCLALVATAFSTRAEDRPYYMWRDADGVMNFSQTRPRDMSAEELTLRRRDDPTLSNELESAKLTELEIHNRAANAENCRRSREYLTKLQTFKQIFYQDEEGWWQEMTEARRAERIEFARDIIAESCGGNTTASSSDSNASTSP